MKLKQFLAVLKYLGGITRKLISGPGSMALSSLTWKLFLCLVPVHALCLDHSTQNFRVQ